jgi:hypothetical protein
MDRRAPDDENITRKHTDLAQAHQSHFEPLLISVKRCARISTLEYSREDE